MVPRFWRIGRQMVIPAILGRNPNPTTTTLIRPPPPPPPPFSTIQQQPSPSYLQLLPPLSNMRLSSYLKPSSSSILSPSSIITPELLLPPPILTDIPLSFYYSSPYTTTYTHDYDEIPEDGEFLREHLPPNVVKLLGQAQAAVIYFSKSSSGWAGELTAGQITLWLKTLIVLLEAYEALKPYGLVLAETIKDTYLRVFGNKEEIQQEQEQAPAPTEVPETKPEPEPPERERELKPESAESKPEPAESKTESAEPKAETAEPKPKTEPEPQSVPKSEPAEPKSEAVELEPKPKPKPESESPEPKPRPEVEQAEPKPEPKPESEPEEESTASFFQLLVGPNHIKYAFVLFGVTEEDHVGAEIIGENKLVVETFVDNGPDSDTITTTTLHLPPGDFSNVLLRTKFSVKNGIFLVELQGFQIANSSSSSSSHGASS